MPLSLEVIAEFHYTGQFSSNFPFWGRWLRNSFRVSFRGNGLSGSFPGYGYEMEMALVTLMGDLWCGQNGI